MTRAPRCFTVGSWAQGTARGSSRAGRRPAPGWSGGLPIASLSLQQYPTQDSLAEWSKALASGASPQGRGFEPNSCHTLFVWLRHALARCRPRRLQIVRVRVPLAS